MRPVPRMPTNERPATANSSPCRSIDERARTYCSRMNSSDSESTQSNEPVEHHLSCAACRVIDRADGVEDGQLWNPDHYTSPSRRNLFALMRRVQDHTADSITSIAGSMRFVYIHVIWFGVWIALNVGLIKVNHEFDKFPFGLLTMIVSLEAIFLSTFVMISQNRADAKRQVLAEIGRAHV